MTHEVVHVETGKWRERCYVIAAANRDALIIDPGASFDEIVAVLERRPWRPLAILNTHGHFDHIGAVAPLMERFQLPFYLHRGDFLLVRQANLYGRLFESTGPVKVPAVTHDLKEQPETFDIGPFRIRWLETPGHTPGSCCFVLGDDLFSGDTILARGTGRTDLPGANKRQLAESLGKLAALNGRLTVRAGHGESLLLSECLARVSSKQVTTE